MITIYSGGSAAGASWGLWGANVTAGQAFAITVAGGFAAGSIQSGTVKGGLYGAFGAAAFFGVGTAFQNAQWAQQAQYASIARVAKTVSHGMVGGVMSDLQGGKFGHGFVSAGATQAVSPQIDRIGSVPGQVVAAAALGGSVSAVTGGKFANGAVTSAFSYAAGKISNKVNASYSEGDSGIFGAVRKMLRGLSGYPAELADPTVRSGIMSAWDDAMTDDPLRRHEEGGFWGLEENGSYGIRRWPSGGRHEIAVPRLPADGMYQGLNVKGDFHIHPSPRPVDEFGTSWRSAPSQRDLIQTKSMGYSGHSYIIDNRSVYWVNSRGSWGVVGSHQKIFPRE